MEQSSFDVTISALDAETSALDVEMSAFGASMSAIAQTEVIRCNDIGARCGDVGARRSYGVTGDIGVEFLAIAELGPSVGRTPQMCNRVNNYGDMTTFSKPATVLSSISLIIIFTTYHHKQLR